MAEADGAVRGVEEVLAGGEGDQRLGRLEVGFAGHRVDHPGVGTQVTYNDWPLYYYAADSAPGDTNGEGSGGVWYVVDPTGNPIDND